MTLPQKHKKLYQRWGGMVARCYNKNHQMYHYYGGRGIKVCDRWRTFANFLEDMGEPPTSKHTLDRIDNDGDYEPSNCRWATRKENSHNSSRVRMITFNGKTQCVSEWAREYGLTPDQLDQRINRRGWDFERALTQPLARQSR